MSRRKRKSLLDCSRYNLRYNLDPILPFELLKIICSFFSPVEAVLFRLLFPDQVSASFTLRDVKIWLCEHLIDGNIAYLNFLKETVSLLEFQQVCKEKTKFTLVTDETPLFQEKTLRWKDTIRLLITIPFRWDFSFGV